MDSLLDKIPAWVQGGGFGALVYALLQAYRILKESQQKSRETEINSQQAEEKADTERFEIIIKHLNEQIAGLQAVSAEKDKNILMLQANKDELRLEISTNQNKYFQDQLQCEKDKAALERKIVEMETQIKLLQWINEEDNLRRARNLEESNLDGKFSGK